MVPYILHAEAARELSAAADYALRVQPAGLIAGDDRLQAAVDLLLLETLRRAHPALPISGASAPIYRPLLAFCRAAAVLRRRGGIARTVGSALKNVAGAGLAAVERRGGRITLWEYLEATGEYDGTVARLRALYLRLRNDPRTGRDSSRWFEDAIGEARRRLGKDFSGVGRDGTARRGDFREDRFLQAKGRDEYLVNQLAGELLSRRDRTAVRAADKVTLLLPGCMRVPDGKGCAAERAGTDGLGLRCRRCSADCPVAGIAAEENERLEVRILLHGSSFTGRTIAPAETSSRAVIGVACVPNLIAGGEAARALGLPSLCVPLAYPGCAAHWLKTGVPTVPEEGLLRRRLAEAGCSGRRSAAAPRGSARVLQL